MRRSLRRGVAGHSVRCSWASSPLRSSVRALLSHSDDLVGRTEESRRPRLRVDAFFEPTPGSVAARFGRWNGDPEAGWLAGLAGGDLVCLAGWTGWDPARLLCVGTRASHRGRGWASALIPALVARVGSVEAETDASAVGFYRKAGFTVTELTRDYGGGPVVRYLCRREVLR